MTAKENRPAGNRTAPTMTISNDVGAHTTTADRRRRQRADRREHLLSGCSWCIGMRDAADVLTDATADDLRLLWKRLADDQARDRVAAIAQRHGHQQ